MRFGSIFDLRLVRTENDMGLRVRYGFSNPRGSLLQGEERGGWIPFDEFIGWEPGCDVKAGEFDGDHIAVHLRGCPNNTLPIAYASVQWVWRRIASRDPDMREGYIGNTDDQRIKQPETTVQFALNYGRVRDLDLFGIDGPTLPVGEFVPDCPDCGFAALKVREREEDEEHSLHVYECLDHDCGTVFHVHKRFPGAFISECPPEQALKAI